MGAFWGAARRLSSPPIFRTVGAVIMGVVDDKNLCTPRVGKEGVTLRQRLFDPFAATKAQWAGFGLTLVAALIAAQGGIVDIESEPGRVSVEFGGFD